MSYDDDNLWSQTTGYGYRGPKRDYLTVEQNCRLERMRVARMLWKGHHRRAFLDEGRTQFNFKEIKVQGVIRKPYIAFNLLRMVTTTITDLLIGEQPLLRIAAQDKGVDGEDLLPGVDQDAVDALKDRSDLHRVFYDACKSASWSAEGAVEVVRWSGQVYIQDCRSDEIFPLGARQPDGQYSSYARFAEAQIDGPRHLLLQSLYMPGKITRQCFFLQGGQKTTLADMALWPVKNPDGSPLAAEVSTGIDWNTIVWMANEIDEGNPVSDYDGLLALQDELNHKQTQLAIVIAQHADPKLAAPQTSGDPNGNLRSDAGVYFFRTKEEIPQYITWNAELAAAMEGRDFTLNALCIAAEVSQGLLGLEHGAAPDSARKLRLQATKSLSRAKRKAAFVKPFIRTAINTALKLENAGKRVQVSMATVGAAAVELRDGLPVDELDQAQTISLLTGGKATMSVARGVELQIEDPAAAAIEIQRLKEDAAAAVPSILVGEPALPKTGNEQSSDTSAEGQDAQPADPYSDPSRQTTAGGLS